MKRTDDNVSTNESDNHKGNVMLDFLDTLKFTENHVALETTPLPIPPVQSLTTTNTTLTPSKLPKTPKSSKSKGDINDYNRHYLFVLYYNGNTTGTCCICEFNWVDLSACQRFHMAHVVARKDNGNNVSLWNRVPVCAACNANLKGTPENLLDFIFTNYPGRLIHIVKMLFKTFCFTEALFARQYFSNSMETFVKTMYGTESTLFTETEHLQNNVLQKQLQKMMPDYALKSLTGRIVHQEMYNVLTWYDDCMAQRNLLQMKAKQLSLQEAELEKQQEILTFTKKNLLLEKADLETNLTALHQHMDILEQASILEQLPFAKEE